MAINFQKSSVLSMPGCTLFIEYLVDILLYKDIKTGTNGMCKASRINTIVTRIAPTDSKLIIKQSMANNVSTKKM